MPCLDCISFAICKNTNKEINCTIIDEYIRNSELESIQDVINFVEGIFSRKAHYVTQTFNSNNKTQASIKWFQK